MYRVENEKRIKKIKYNLIVNVIVVFFSTIFFFYIENKINNYKNLHENIREVEINLYEFSFAYKALLMKTNESLLPKLTDSQKDLDRYLTIIDLEIESFPLYYQNQFQQLRKDIDELYYLYSVNTPKKRNFVKNILKLDDIIDEKFDKKIIQKVIYLENISFLLLGIFLFSIFYMLYFLYIIFRYFIVLSNDLKDDINLTLTLVDKIKNEEKVIDLSKFKENEFMQIATALVNMKNHLEDVIFSKKERDILLESIGKYRFVIHSDETISHISNSLNGYVNIEKLNFKHIKTLIENKILQNLQWNLKRNDGQIVYAVMTGVVLNNDAILLFGNDFIEQDEASFLKENENAFVVVNEKGKIIAHNYLFEKLLRIDNTFIDSNTLESLCSLQYCNSSFSFETMKSLAQTKETLEVVINPSFQENKRYAKLICSKLEDTQDTLYGVLFKDLSQVRLSEEKIYQLAYHDSLTGLANRAFLLKYINKLIAHAKRIDEEFIVVFLDLDNFKNINDTLGHETGDETLRLVANRLHSVFREEDLLVRLGGDEFCIVTKNLNINDVMIRLFKKFREENNLNVVVSVSVGVSSYPKDGKTSLELLKASDTAMYEAKNAGKNTYRFYNKELLNELNDEEHMKLEIKEALLQGHFELYYQPQINLHENTLHGVEALIRWNDPKRGMIPPLKFIPFAEKHNLINDITRWVILEACKQQQRWKGQNISTLISVNVTVSFFESPSFVDELKGILLQTQADATKIKLEITESQKQNIEHVIEIGTVLSSLGFEIAIDDFGTGYSSLGILNNEYIKLLKVDKSFIDSCTDDEDTQLLLDAIINIAKSMHLKIIIEGVESLEQIEYLKKYDEIVIQGYYFSKPLSKGDVENFIMQNKIICEENNKKNRR